MTGGTKIRAPQFFQVPAATPPAECKSCKATIYFVELGSGKKMPVDCDVDGGAAPTAREGGQGISHFASCPAANSFRRKRS